MGSAEGKSPSSAKSLFGTDGVRGVANLAPTTPEAVLRLGRAAAYACRSGGSGRQTIVIGRDTRLSGDMLEPALTAGVCSMGVDALLAGVLPTPAIALLTRTLSAGAGAVISASHNPFQDNGIKFFAADGFKVPDAVEAQIEQLVLRDDIDDFRPTAGDLGRVIPVGDAAARYVAFVKQSFPRDRTLDGIKIVLDCAHGAAYQVGARVFGELGAAVVLIGASPDGQNINRDCGALHPQPLRDVVRAERAHVGIAFDGDADRAICVDDAGAVVDGDEILAIIATEMLERGTLKQGTVVGTVMSNMGLEMALRARGARLVRVPIGDRYVVAEMRRLGCNLGGEPSGHIVLLDHSTTGDGILAALAVVRLVVERQRPLSELRRVMTRLPQALRNVRVAQRRDLNTIPAVRETIERITAECGARGRVLVRYSGTEPLVRVMVEGEDTARVEAHADEIAASLRTHLSE